MSKESHPLPCRVIERIVDNGLRRYGEIVGKPNISRFVRKANGMLGIGGAIAAYGRSCGRNAVGYLEKHKEPRDLIRVETWKMIIGISGIMEGLIVLATRTPTYAERLHSTVVAGTDWVSWEGYGTDTHAGSEVYGEVVQDYRSHVEGPGVRVGDAERNVPGEGTGGFGWI
jgi:hypothetical protein